MRDAAEEAALLARARAGDRDAFWRLVAPSIEPLLRLACRMLKRREDAEDVVQEVMIQALDGLAEFKGLSRFETWLHRITVNQALMKLRKRRADVFSLDAPRPAGGEDPLPVERAAEWPQSALDELIRREAEAHLDQALQELPIDLRTVIVLRELNGLSLEEIAATLEIPHGAVKWRLEAARRALRDRLVARLREHGGS